jgi:alpha-ketoglutarate-dependent taurine dioxygenase
MSGDPRFRIETLTDEGEARRLLVRWVDGHESRFHYVWLRHACFYPANPGTDPRDESLHPPDDPDRLTVETLSLDGGVLSIRWAPDGETTRHEARWLREHCYSDAARRARKHRPSLWDGAAAAALPCFDYADLNDDEGVYRLFLRVRDPGLARLHHVPATREALEQVAGLFGPIHETNYGRVFDVRTDSHIAVAANKASFLAPHTDENYRHAPPGISLFHCLEACEKAGGESLLVDGFLAARRLAEHDPAAFELLSRVPIRFVGDSHENDHLWAEGRVICRDVDGDVVGIRYTDRTLPPLDLPEAEIEPMYRALRSFARELYSPDLPLRYLMRPGDLHIFDNQRVLHARTAFDPGAGTRHLQQCAVDRDEFYYRLRLMEIRRGLDDARLVMAGGALG